MINDPLAIAWYLWLTLPLNQLETSVMVNAINGVFTGYTRHGKAYWS